MGLNLASILTESAAAHGERPAIRLGEVGQIFERGVILKIDAATAARLPKPNANPASLSVHPGDLAPGRPGALRRAWDSLTGRR